MARTVNQEERNAKRHEILDAAQRLVYRKGYERMTIQDILLDLGMSSGAFYHYFDSKPAVMHAMIERMQQEAEAPLLPIVHDPKLSAVEKLQRFLETLNRSRVARMTFVATLLHVWFADDNAIVRQKVDDATIERRAPLLTEIIQQGVHEGIFTTGYPAQVSQAVLAIVLGMGNALAKLLLAAETMLPETVNLDEIIATHAATAEAMERVLGAPPGCLPRADAATVQMWLKMMQGNG